MRCLHRTYLHAALMGAASVFDMTGSMLLTYTQRAHRQLFPALSGKQRPGAPDEPFPKDPAQLIARLQAWAAAQERDTRAARAFHRAICAGQYAMACLMILLMGAVVGLCVVHRTGTATGAAALLVLVQWSVLVASFKIRTLPVYL